MSKKVTRAEIIKVLGMETFDRSDWRIEIWPFDKAPERYRNMCNVGGDEDWIALVPAKLAGSWLPFLEQNKFGNDVDQIPMNDGTGRMLLVSTHA